MLASPFLRSHAASLVAWREWGAEAIEAARASERPLLLHIGCDGSPGADAMRLGAFSDAGTAEAMNREFICVLVDRDEQAELDRLMQLAYQMLTREDGGWPLNLFLTADEAVPFFGVGFYPAEPASGLPAFRSVLARVAQYHREQQSSLREQGKALREALRHVDTGSAEIDALPSAAIFDVARRELEAGFDRENGGWGKAPKFPQVLAIQHLLRHWQAGALGEQPDLKALFMASFTLTRIADGGLRDSDGGFFRYCHDAAWREPQPEKAIADNAPLLEAYAEAALLTGESRFREVAEESAAYLQSRLARPEELPGLVPQALAAKALAVAARALGREDLKAAALAGLDRLRGIPPDGLEDHVSLLDAILATAVPGDRPADMAWAITLADAVLDRFEDRERGGFFATRGDAPLFHRLREFADSGLSSGNARAAQLLLQLDGLEPTPRYKAAALRCLRAAARRMQAQPLGHLGLLSALARL